MTADSDKDCTHCLVCNSKAGVSTRNSVRIFNDSTNTTSEKPLADIIATVLKTDINEESVHSLVICKKCFKLFNEVKHYAHSFVNSQFVEKSYYNFFMIYIGR